MVEGAASQQRGGGCRGANPRVGRHQMSEVAGLAAITRRIRPPLLRNPASGCSATTASITRSRKSREYGFGMGPSNKANGSDGTMLEDSPVLDSGNPSQSKAAGWHSKTIHRGFHSPVADPYLASDRLRTFRLWTVPIASHRPGGCSGDTAAFPCGGIRRAGPGDTWSG